MSYQSTQESLDSLDNAICYFIREYAKQIPTRDDVGGISDQISEVDDAVRTVTEELGNIRESIDKLVAVLQEKR